MPFLPFLSSAIINPISANPPAAIVVSTKSFTAAEVGIVVSLSLEAIPSDSASVPAAISDVVSASKLSVYVFDQCHKYQYEYAS